MYVSHVLTVCHREGARYLPVFEVEGRGHVGVYLQPGRRLVLGADAGGPAPRSLSVRRVKVKQRLMPAVPPGECVVGVERENW